MAGELEKIAEAFMAAIDAQDAERVVEAFAEDGEGFDEIGGRWVRGRHELDGHLHQVLGAVSGVQSELRDPQERVWGDVGVLTCWLDQQYTYEGTVHQISAPTTFLFRREDAEWKMALYHSIPLPDQQ